MANTIAELHVDTPNPRGFVHDLETWLQQMIGRGHAVEAAKVTHDAGTHAEDVEHLVGGPEDAASAPAAVASTEPGGDAEAGVASEAPTGTATVEG